MDTDSPVGLRDRALVSLMIYTFARVGAAPHGLSGLVLCSTVFHIDFNKKEAIVKSWAR